MSVAVVLPRDAGFAPIDVRGWRSGDARLVADAERALSRASLTARFFTGTSSLPPAYLRRLLAGPGESWGATVALDGDRLIGWGEWGRRPEDSASAELGVLVVDAWQRRGVGSRLVRSLLPRAIRCGIRVLHVDVESGNAPARAAVRSLFGDIQADSLDGDVLHFSVPLIHAVGG